MSKKRRRDGPGQPPSQSAAAAAGPNRNPTTTSTDASKSNPNSTASPAGKRQRTGPQNPSAHLNAGTSNTTAATDSGSGIYARLPSAVMNDLTLSAGEAPPVDPKTGLFTPGFVNRLLTNTQDLTATVSDVNEASTTTNTKSASTLSSAAKSAIYQSRVQGKVLLVDNPPRDESAKEARREERRKQRRRKVLMNSKDKRKLGIYEIPVDCRKYELFEPLHKLWTQYMHELLGEHITNPMNVMPKLLKADYHGCILTVVRSKCPSYVNVTGIVVKETENTFQLITKNNKLKTIPKQHTIFTFSLNNASGSHPQIVTLYGDHFKTRSGERVAKKFKGWSTVDL